jgi:hypothetical protein
MPAVEENGQFGNGGDCKEFADGTFNGRPYYILRCTT